MTSTKQRIIAGEPVANLVAGLRSFEVNQTGSGAIRVRCQLEGEIGASWIRAIERYGADELAGDRPTPVEQRHADELVRIVSELNQLVDETADSLTGL